MRARWFWSATIGFFCTFFSCFAPGALGIYYKKPPAQGGLGLLFAAQGVVDPAQRQQGVGRAAGGRGFAQLFQQRQGLRRAVQLDESVGAAQQ